MSVDQVLFGLKRPLGRRRKIAPKDLRPLGTADEVADRLLQKGIVRRDGSALRMGDVELTMEGDPVTSIHARGCAAWELLPLVDALGGSTAIFDLQRGTWHDPDRLRVGLPVATRAPVSTPRTTGLFGSGIQELWTLELTNGDAYRPAAVLGHRSIAIADEDEVWLVDRRSGSARWALRIGRGPQIAISEIGIVIAGCMDGWVLGLAEGSGALVWRTGVGDRVLSVAATEDFAAIGTIRELVFLDARTGEVCTRHDFGGPVRGLAFDGDGVLALLPDGAAWVPVPTGGPSGSQTAFLACGFPNGATTFGGRVVIQTIPALHVCSRRNLVPEFTIRIGRLQQPLPGADAGATLVPAHWFLSIADHVTTHEHRLAVGLVRSNGSIGWERESPFPGPRPVSLPNGTLLVVARGETKGSIRLLAVDPNVGVVRHETGDLTPPGPVGRGACEVSVDGSVALLSWGSAWTLLSLSQWMNP